MRNQAHISSMAEKHPKRPRDPNQLAKHIIGIATGEVEDPPVTTPLSKKEAAELGGKRRAVTLSKKRKTEIASKAARARWKEKT